MKHEGYILKDDPWYRPIVEQSENVPHQTRALTVDARGHPCLAQILARESGYEDLGIAGQPIQLRYVRTAFDVRKMLGQHSLSCRSNLTQQDSLMPAKREPELKPSYPGEQPDDFHGGNPNRIAPQPNPAEPTTAALWQ